MKKIAYIELDTHPEIAQNFMELMKDSKVFSVDYYFSKKIRNQVGETYSNVFVTESSAILNQLKNKNYELVIIGTVHRYFNIFEKITYDFNTSIIVHNLNFCTISKFQLFLNIFKNDFVYRLKLMLKENLFSTPNVFKSAKNLLILDQSLTLKNKKFTFKYLPVFYNQYHFSHQNKVFTIVIPGTVSQQRRDYLHVLKTLKTFNNSQKYQVVFLGKALEKELLWIKEFDQIKSENISIHYFTEKVSSLIFNEWMQKADVLWCPIQSETEFFSQKEIYGKTKMSGNIGDAIKYGKQAIFPSDFVNEYPFVHRESEDVLKQLFQLKNNNSFNFQNDFNKVIILKNMETQLLK